MRTTFVFLMVMLVTAAMARQQATASSPPTAETEAKINDPAGNLPSQPTALARKLWLSGRPAWPLPPKDLPTFGQRTADSIKVAIHGDSGCVKKPGYYFLQKGSTVSNLIDAAQGLHRRATWSHLSGIQRQATNNAWEAVRFSTHSRDIESSIALRDGDMIYMGVCAYLESKSPVWKYPRNDLPTFGEPGTNSIRVMIYGDVTKPGVYFLPRLSSVLDALKATQGAGFRAYWGGNSGIQRQIADDKWEVIQFSRGNHEVDSSITLQDGDMIKTGKAYAE